MSSTTLPGIGSHHSARPDADEWLTPPHLLEALGHFDLDPCASMERPDWTNAARVFTLADGGLMREWRGRVWLNPPYSAIESWMRRMAGHDCGIALTFARVETSWWFESIWTKASAILFLRGRLTFHRPNGRPASANSGGPSALIAYGKPAAQVLADCGLRGAFVEGWRL